MNKRFIILGMIGLVLLGMGLLLNKTQQTKSSYAEPLPDGQTQMLVYKDTSCDCCGNFIGYAKGYGFEATVENRDDMEAVKEQFHVPSQLESCHTIKIGKYVVEGHVPVEAIQKLLTDQPDIAGIALPGMPPGAPGMPGSKGEPFIVYSFTQDGQVAPFMTI